MVFKNRFSIVRALLIFGSLVQFSCENKMEKIVPKKTALTESVYSSVTIQPDSLYQAYASVGGILDKNLVEEGDSVFKGTPISQIINTNPKLNSDNAKLALQLAQENYSGSSAVLKGLEDEIHAATLSFQSDSVNYSRQKRLWNQKIGSKVEFDNRKLAYELSRNNLNLLKSRYDRTKNELMTQLQQAQNNYKSSQVTTRDFTIRSKVNGKVYGLFKESGEIVSSMEPLASIGSVDTFLIEMLVDEVDIVRIQVHQKVLLTLDAYHDKVFEASISKIYPRKDERLQTFKVEALFVNPPEVLYPGLSGEGNIIIAQRDNAVVIPKSYLIEGNKVQTANGLIELELGLQNLDQVEILSGIDETVEIIKPEK